MLLTPMALLAVELLGGPVGAGENSRSIKRGKLSQVGPAFTHRGNTVAGQFEPDFQFHRQGLAAPQADVERL